MGTPPVPVMKVRMFWQLKAGGVSTKVAATRAGFSERHGRYLVTKAGGVIPTVKVPDVVSDRGEGPQGRYLSWSERDLLSVKHAAGQGVREIARDMRRSPSTISRELKRNTISHKRYAAGSAQRCAEARLPRPKPRKLTVNVALGRYVWDKLSGAEHFSPEQICARLVIDFPDDLSMRISPETIYQCIFVLPKGELKREVKRCLRTGRAVRKPHRQTDGRRQVVPEELLIAHRPPEIEDRALPGDWEGDCILGKDGLSQIGTLVDRMTRYVILLHLPNGRTGEETRDAMAAAIGALPPEMKRSITWDQGSEMRGAHRDIAIAHNLDVWFCNPHSPWERGTNENTNGLLRQYFPKGTDLSIYSAEDLLFVARAMNNRPRKALDFRTPNESFTALLTSTP
ncbi:IS30 family transposase [Williamsia soli]|uniref:IS30 family transposase n=1 Tax=Williamsia soli TaxID=364929 RepID=UPI001EFF8651|nr:IS30 family transposase [Williamsia soli]